MKAMLLTQIREVDKTPAPLEFAEIPTPRPGSGEVLIRVSVCAICHTELDEIEGRTRPPRLPIVPGHQVVGYVEELGAGATSVAIGDRVGVAWIHSACGKCEHCRGGNENLCPEFRATGRDVDGGYAEYVTVPAAFAHAIPEQFSDAEAAPFLCAGAIGFRSLRLAGIQDGQAIGLTGFGASAHLVLQMIKHRYPHSPVYVFARSGSERTFAATLGASWTGTTMASPPGALNAIIDTTPAWEPVLAALKVLAPGGRLVINAIRKESTDRHLLASLEYPTHLWMEKEIKSVANVTRSDVGEFLRLAATIRLKPELQEFPFIEANSALREMKSRIIRGAKVLRIS
jgi:alcohol dehydrogenase, propanol-preferring